MASAQGDVLADVRDGVATVTLNRPASLNALTLSMFHAIDAWLRSWRDSPEVRVIAFKGAGGKAFCAGGDVRQVRESHLAGEPVWKTYFVHEYAFDHGIYSYPKPIVALMDGITMGGGMGIAQGAALRIVTPRSRVAMPETAIGLFPDVGATVFLNRAPGQVGLYLALSGATIGAADALYAGLADACLGDEALAQLDGALRTAASGPDPRTAISRWAASAASEPPPGELAGMRQAIDRHFARDSVEAIINSLEHEPEPAAREWAARTRELLLRRSPTSLKVTLRQLHEGRGLALGDALRRELGMVRAAFDIGDVAEGVRAVLVDKDHRPRWQPATLAQVTPERVAAFFQPWWTPGEHPLRHL